MTLIGRIFTDLRASAQSVFYLKILPLSDDTCKLLTFEAVLNLMRKTTIALPFTQKANPLPTARPLSNEVRAT